MLVWKDLKRKCEPKRSECCFPAIPSAACVIVILLLQTCSGPLHALALAPAQGMCAWKDKLTAVLCYGGYAVSLQHAGQAMALERRSLARQTEHGQA